MDQVFALVVAVIPALVGAYFARGGGPDARLLKQARDDLELSDLLPDGRARERLRTHADTAVVQALALRSATARRPVVAPAAVAAAFAPVVVGLGMTQYTGDYQYLLLLLVAPPIGLLAAWPALWARRLKRYVAEAEHRPDA